MSVIATLAGLTALGTIAGIGAQHVSNRKNREFNSAEAQKQRDFEKQMSDTAYQRAVEDMKNAGLNPSMLYASGGTGATTPTGSSAQSGASNSTNNLIGQLGTLMDSVNNARSIDNMTKQNQMNNEKNIYNAVGKILEEIIFKK